MSKRKRKSPRDSLEPLLPKSRSVLNNNPVRQCSLITYVSEEHIKYVLERFSEYIMDWAYCIHDRDVYLEDSDSHKKGEHKETHTHIVLKLWKTVRPSTIVGWFYDPWREQNTLFKRIESTLGNAYAYLDHRNAQDKFQYPSFCIKCSNRDFWEHLDDNFEVDRDSLSQATFDLLDGVPYKDVVRQYGRDFIIHSSCVDNVIRHISYEEQTNTCANINQDTVDILRQDIERMQTTRRMLQNEISALEFEYRNFKNLAEEYRANVSQCKNSR